VSVLYVVVPLALLVVGAAVWAYLWAARDGQFDDLATPSVRALHDDPPAPAPDDAEGH
jgi:cbb3-type cytochrome oxidase maturation protein